MVVGASAGAWVGWEIAAVGDIACQSFSQSDGEGACRSDEVAALLDDEELEWIGKTHQTLLRREDRTRHEDDELLYATFASAFHWLKAEGAAPENRARSEDGTVST